MKENIQLIFPDGSKKEYAYGSKLEDVIGSISSSLKKKCVGGSINGRALNMYDSICEDGEIVFVTQESLEGFNILNHTTAHVLAQAMSELYPHAQMGVGPVIEEGFYYDFDLGEERLSDSDLSKIEKKMMEISNRDLVISHRTMKKEDAAALFPHDAYKRELIDAVEGDVVEVYQQGSYYEVCRGPHLSSTKKVHFFKLLSVAGAYWRGDSNNKMLVRIYGTAWYKEEELKQHLENLENRKLRDHRRLGKELDLFMMSEYGPGFPFWLPNGMALKSALVGYWNDVHRIAGYDMIATPIMLNRELWTISGHWLNYRENMYTSNIDDSEFAIKPMNCPGAILTYKNRIHSYRDLPMRYAEFGTVHRHEASGALAGLFRVRSFTQDDAHIFMTEEQIEDEISHIILLYKMIYEEFNLKFHIELSTRPEDKYIGEIATWDKAEISLANACKKAGFDYKINPGDGAFYGPKLDFKLRDSMNRIWQCGTIQLDMNLPERFDMTYIAQDGTKKRPVMVHRALFGSLERFIGILIEHFGGAFPVWLAPIQVRLIPVNVQAHGEYCQQLKKQLSYAGIRVDIDDRDEKLSYRVREAQVKKIPFGLVIGDQEVGSQTVTYRRYGETESTSAEVKQFIEDVLAIQPKTILEDHQE